jgi:hypothetical protein
MKRLIGYGSGARVGRHVGDKTFIWTNCQPVEVCLGRVTRHSEKGRIWAVRA